MKKIKILYFIILLTLLNSGCSFSDQNNDLQLTPTTNPDSSFISESTPEPSLSTQSDVMCYNLISYELSSELESIYGCAPTGMLVDLSLTKIGWIFEGERYSGNFAYAGEEINFWNGYDFIYPNVYFGQLTQLSNNVYEADGFFIQEFKDSNDYISDSVDFYMVFEPDMTKLYIVTEEMDIEELKKYSSNNYLYFAE